MNTDRSYALLQFRDPAGKFVMHKITELEKGQLLTSIQQRMSAWSAKGRGTVGMVLWGVDRAFCTRVRRDIEGKNV